VIFGWTVAADAQKQPQWVIGCATVVSALVEKHVIFLLARTDAARLAENAGRTASKREYPRSADARMRGGETDSHPAQSHFAARTRFSGIRGLSTARIDCAYEIVLLGS
jgi:hypothetical protein